MKMNKNPFELLNTEEIQFLQKLNSPFKIQQFLDELPYSADDFYRCPRRVLTDRKAHCFDGALFAAAALHFHGHLPLILDMIPNERDDDHLLALFKRNGCWGAIAKSNFSGLRFREPIYHRLRELVLSYFENYYNVAGEKTLRGYTAALSLRSFEQFNWIINDDAMEKIADRLDQIPRYELLTAEMISNLGPMDKRSYDAGMLGVNHDGLFQPAADKK